MQLLCAICLFGEIIYMLWAAEFTLYHISSIFGGLANCQTKLTTCTIFKWAL